MTDEGAISPKSLPPGGKVPPKGADEGAMIERFRSSQGDISPPAGGEFLSQRWERNQRIAGDAADGHFVPIGPLSPGPPLRGLPLEVSTTLPARKI